MAQSFRHPTRDFGLGQAFTVCVIKPHGAGLCADIVEPGWDSVSFSASPQLACTRLLTHALSLSKRKIPLSLVQINT